MRSRAQAPAAPRCFLARRASPVTPWPTSVRAPPLLDYRPVRLPASSRSCWHEVFASGIAVPRLIVAVHIRVLVIYVEGELWAYLFACLLYMIHVIFMIHVLVWFILFMSWHWHSVSNLRTRSLSLLLLATVVRTLVFVFPPSHPFVVWLPGAGTSV